MLKRTTILLVTLILMGFAFTLPAFAQETVQPGDNITGELERSDEQLSDGCYYDEYRIDCEVGALLTITQSSEDIDSYLIVKGPHNRQWENDDYTSINLDSRLSILINERGNYSICCSSYSRERGEYELSIEQRQPPRFFGIFVGIENYPKEIPDAPLCDRDAEAMYNAFIDSGLMERTDGVVLTNENAKLRQLQRAFENVKAEAGPDDIFFFFFSGHGDQVEADSSDTAEIDGLDECLCLRDTDLTDNDFADLLDGMDAGLSVIVLDACNSGGLARDVVDEPGRVLYASSEEDSTSDFAPQLDAGGYLSVFFREAIEGDADLDGDGMIMMGELTRFLEMRYYEEVPDPSNAVYGYQELVHERGLAPQDTIFCWFDPTTGRIKGKDGDGD